MSSVAPGKYTLASRLAGLLSDLLLLALFLTLGVALLNILIQTIVLVVGIAREVQAHSAVLMAGLPRAPSEPGRFTRDMIDLGIAVLSAIAAAGVYLVYFRLRRKYIHLFVEASFESFVSKRYLLAREGGRLVTLISGVSVLGVAVGVMALIVVISVMEGFDQTLVRKFMGVFSHIQVLADPRVLKDSEMPEAVYTDLMDRLEKKPFVKGIAPIVDFEGVVRNDATDSARRRVAFALIRGIDPERELRVTEFQRYVKMGKSTPGHHEVVLGASVAERLNVLPGDTVIAMGETVQTANRLAVKQTQLRVVGIFNSGLYDVDDKFMYTDLATVQELRLIGKSVTSLHIKIDDPERVDEVAMALIPELPYGYGVRTWQMLNPQFFEALWIEKVAMFIILLLIVLVAALNIIGTLVMTVVQKTRDIGVLKSMGASNGAILRIFLYHGFLIGLIGTSLGVTWGLRLCRFVSRDIEKIFRLPGGVYGIDRLPVVIEPWLIVFMALCALIICIVASIVPAYQAARLNPVEALRYD